MTSAPPKPLIVQADLTVLLEQASPGADVARDRIIAFSELVKAPEHVHTYRLTPLSIWNARAAGLAGDEIVSRLEEFSRYPLPKGAPEQIQELASRFGLLELRRFGDQLVLSVESERLAGELEADTSLAPFWTQRLGPHRLTAANKDRGRLKRGLISIGWPVRVLAGYVDGDELEVELREESQSGQPFDLREYQLDAVRRFHRAGSEEGGSGVIVLPCGAGKTVVGLACLQALGMSTLILTTSTTSVRQWIGELLDKTTLSEEEVGEYTGAAKVVRPVTVATYHILSARDQGSSELEHMKLIDEQRFGLIIYDEVHTLPAPVFQVTAELQARRRLGLTATLVREDGREDEVFALIGPKCMDVPWRELESQGWIAKASCIELRVPMPDGDRLEYARAPERAKHRLAAENANKKAVVSRILRRHEGDPTLIIGTYVEQLRVLAEELGVPLLSGKTSQKKRDSLFAAFRSGEVKTLAVTKVANFAVDLPDASVAIQVSGTFGSRQEEAQRLGRLLRPKEGENQAHFYTLVSRDTKEHDFALNRQRFLCEQGYAYRIVDDVDAFLEPQPMP